MTNPVVADLLARFRSEGDVAVPEAWNATIGAEFEAAHVTDDETLAEIARVHDELGLLIDPHTAVGVKAAVDARGDQATPMVVLSTAHPAKFPDAVEAACGIRPQLPARLADLHQRPERITRAPNDLGALQELIREGIRH